MILAAFVHFTSITIRRGVPVTTIVRDTSTDGAGGFDCDQTPGGPIPHIGCGPNAPFNTTTPFECTVEFFDGAFACTGALDVNVTLDCHPQR